MNACDSGGGRTGTYRLREGAAVKGGVVESVFEDHIKSKSLFSTTSVSYKGMTYTRTSGKASIREGGHGHVGKRRHPPSFCESVSAIARHTCSVVRPWLVLYDSSD